MVGLGDRPHDREPQARAAGQAVTRRHRCGGSARRRGRARTAGFPGPSSMTDEADAVGPDPLDLEPDQAVGLGGVLDRVAREVAQGLSEPVGVGGQRAGRHLPELEISLGGEREAVPELRDERRSGRRAACAGSRCARIGRARADRRPDGEIREISSCSSASTRCSSSGLRVRVGGEHLELALHHGQGRPQLVRGVGDELALRLERGFETVEHVVERLGQHPDLAGAGARRPACAAAGRRRRRGWPAQRGAATAPIPDRPPGTTRPAPARARSPPRAGTRARRPPASARRRSAPRRRRRRRWCPLRVSAAR